jgi:hypothetical protein
MVEFDEELIFEIGLEVIGCGQHWISIGSALDQH